MNVLTHYKMETQSTSYWAVYCLTLGQQWNVSWDRVNNVIGVKILSWRIFSPNVWCVDGCNCGLYPSLSCHFLTILTARNRPSSSEHHTIKCYSFTNIHTSYPNIAIKMLLASFLWVLLGKKWRDETVCCVPRGWQYLDTIMINNYPSILLL